MKKGLLIILSGPSGVGKGTVRHQIVQHRRFDLVYSISMTTRAPRDKEVDGEDYYFVSKEEFEKRLKNDEFLEHAEFVGNYYGTPKDKVEQLRNEGKNVFLEIEVQGANQVMQKVNDDRVVSFFLMPPSLEALEERIRKRKSEPEDVIQARLNKAKLEMKLASNYDYVIENDTVTNAENKICQIVIELLSK